MENKKYRFVRIKDMGNDFHLYCDSIDVLLEHNSVYCVVINNLN